MTRESAVNVAVVVLAICALMTTGLVVRRELLQAQVNSETSIAPIETVDSSVSAAAETGGRLLTNASTRQVLVEFADFQCPACGAFESGLRKIRHERGGKVRVVFRNFPLTAVHPYAMDAAIAAECAGDQAKFIAMHDTLFANQEQFGATSWWVLAQHAGVADSARFAVCLSSSAPRLRIAEDMAAGNAAGVRATPTLIVNGRRVTGIIPQATLDSLLNLPAAP